MKLKGIILAIAALALATTAIAGPDHSKFIKKELKTGKEATARCLKCHKDEAEEFMKTQHWTWALEQEFNGKTVKRGKINVLNNYCISPISNMSQCTRCHAGYDWNKDPNALNDPGNIDCLVCHDTTGTYKKTAGGVAEGVNITRVAKSVGAPPREACGACHFNGGGGVGVKHGDLDPSLEYPEKSLDVHMDVEGNDFTCSECHGGSEGHGIAGHSLGVSPGGTNHIECASCHSEEPHAESRLNTHAIKVSCQTCHIPAFARAEPTKMEWDWSKAGQDLHDDEYQYGKHKYLKKKGTFEWGKNVTPEYAWFNGTADAYTLGDKIDPKKTVKLAVPRGDKNDGKIHPFKVHRGKQIMDAKNNYLLPLHTVDKDGFWTTFDWNEAATIGAKAAGLDYSGEYGFAATEMYWRINHMVAPAKEALGCLDCHGDSGRMNWTDLGYSKDPMGSN